MTYSRLLQIISSETDAETASVIAKRAERELAGQRVTIASRIALQRSDIAGLTDLTPGEIAKRLGVHRSTVYRALKRRTV